MIEITFPEDVHALSVWRYEGKGGITVDVEGTCRGGVGIDVCDSEVDAVGIDSSGSKRGILAKSMSWVAETITGEEISAGTICLRLNFDPPRAIGVTDGSS